MFSKTIGIDLGSSCVRIYAKGKGVVLEEPSVVAIDKASQKLVGVGNSALEILGRTRGNIVVIYPLRNGIISDYALIERMLKAFVKKVSKFNLFKPNVVISIHGGISDVEERAVIDLGMQAGARRMFLLNSPVAAALGAGIDITNAEVNMVVDIGGKTCDIGIVSLGGVVESKTIFYAGDKFDEAIIRYLRRKYNLLIGERTAKMLKESIGCGSPRPNELTIELRGRCLTTGLPKTIEVTSNDTMEAMKETIDSIAEGIYSVLENAPPQLVADVSRNGITLTGGSSLLWGIDRAITERVGITAHIAEKASLCAVLGSGKALDNLTMFESERLNTQNRCVVNP